MGTCGDTPDLRTARGTSNSPPIGLSCEGSWAGGTSLGIIEPTGLMAFHDGNGLLTGLVELQPVHLHALNITRALSLASLKF